MLLLKLVDMIVFRVKMSTYINQSAAGLRVLPADYSHKNMDPLFSLLEIMPSVPAQRLKD